MPAAEFPDESRSLLLTVRSETGWHHQALLRDSRMVECDTRRFRFEFRGDEELIRYDDFHHAYRVARLLRETSA